MKISYIFPSFQLRILDITDMKLPVLDGRPGSHLYSVTFSLHIQGGWHFIRVDARNHQHSPGEELSRYALLFCCNVTHTLFLYTSYYILVLILKPKTTYTAICERLFVVLQTLIRSFCN